MDDTEANNETQDNQDDDPAGASMDHTEANNRTQTQPSPAVDAPSHEPNDPEGDVEVADKSNGATERPFVATQGGQSEDDGQVYSFKFLINFITCCI